MRIAIDLETCLNSGQCAYLQPELFDVDDDGVPTILVSGELTTEQAADAADVADKCPSMSITLIE